MDVISYTSKNVWELKPGNKRRTKTRPPVWKCYEIKTSKSDFYSKAKWTFIGHYNYFVIPTELYAEIANDVPDGVGVIGYEPVSEGPSFTSLKRASKSKPLMTDEVIFSEVMSSMSRELARSTYGKRGAAGMDRNEILSEMVSRLENLPYDSWLVNRLTKAINKAKDIRIKS